MTGQPAQPTPRLGTAAAILLPMSVPLALLLALALTIDGGEQALAALTGAPPAPEFIKQVPALMPPPLGGGGGSSRRLAARAEFAPDRIWGPLTVPLADSSPQGDLPPPQPAFEPALPVMALSLVADHPAQGPMAVAAILAAPPGSLLPAAPGDLLPDPVAFVPFVPPAPAAPPPDDNGVLWDTAAEVRGALGDIAPGTLQLRLWEGQEWLHLGGLLTFRCGMSALYVGINGLPATEPVPLEPCYEGTAAPYAQLDTDNFPPFRLFQPGKVQSVTVRLVLDDGSEMAASFLRSQILTPAL
jgi:hypothetical protein